MTLFLAGVSLGAIVGWFIALALVDALQRRQRGLELPRARRRSALIVNVTRKESSKL